MTMVAQGDLLRRLFQAYTRKDDAAFKSAAQEIIQDERAKNHRLLAEDLERVLLNGSRQSTFGKPAYSSNELPRDRERGFPLVDIAEFSYDWDRMVAQPKLLKPLHELVEEHKHSDLLAASGIKPKQKLLFFGPPGCGKTLAAQVLASVLSCPLVLVRFDAVVSSYLGETAANLRRVFDFIAHGKLVVLFDEFDAIGKDRDNPFEHGELKRVVNTLLQLMDAFRGESVLIAATNHEKLLDSAIWRRFDSVIKFRLPTEQDRVLMLRLFLRSFDCSAVDFKSIGRRTGGFSGSDIELLATEAARRAVLDFRHKILPNDLESVLQELVERARELGLVLESEPESAKKTQARSIRRRD